MLGNAFAVYHHDRNMPDLVRMSFGSQRHKE
jgi:hypothetical protein